MTTKHTPGPWKVAPIGFNCGGDIIGGDGSHVVACGITTGPPHLQLLAEANAHLIAAAPDLLGTLEEILKFLDDNNLHICGPGHTGVCAVPLKRTIQAVLSSAKGEE